VLHQNNVLRLNAWQHVHPGGRLVIQHMVGRDATDELSMYVVLYSSLKPGPRNCAGVYSQILVILLTQVPLQITLPRDPPVYE
jgi:hypothetical protein